jgi:hypothetical protein
MHQPVPVFWSKWMVVLSLLLIIYGLAMVVAPQMMNSTLVGPLLYHAETLHNTFKKLSEQEQFFLSIMNGLLGTVVIGYAVLLGWIANTPFRKGERWAWNAIAVSISAWATLEALFKWVNGLGIWSMAHLGLVVAFGIPLLASYRYFYPSIVYGSIEIPD